MSRLRLGFAVALLAATGFRQARAAPAAVAEGPAYRRLAVIGSPSLQRRGLTDLVGSELQQAGVVLVEREQLKAVEGEQTLNAALGAEGVGRRAEMGRLVKASALVLLSEDGNGKDRRVRVVVAECRQGARLSVEFFPAARPADELAHAIAAGVNRTRQRFADGVKEMVGVPAFISRDFTYEYHPLQAGYAALLREAMAAQPGVAVVEVEEAQAIRHELEIAGGNTGGAVPVFVEAEFEVVAGAKPAAGKPVPPPLVNFKVMVRTSQKSRAVERQGLTLDQAPTFVARELPGEVLPDYREGARRPFTAEQEFAALASRADAFAAVGEWRHAADLRQAALVIHPDSAEQRARLVIDCLSLLESARFTTEPRATGIGADRQRAAQYFAAWQTAAEGFEWRVRTNNVGGDELLGLLGRVFHVVPAGAQGQAAKRDFLEHVAPLTLDPKWLDDPTGVGAVMRANWVESVLGAALHNGGPLTKEDYDVAIKLLNEVVPANQEPSHRLTDLLWHSQPASQYTPQFFDFLGQLERSDRPLNRILAREAMLAWQVSHEQRIDDAALAEVEKLRTEYEALTLLPFPHNTAVVNELNGIRHEVIGRRELIAKARAGATQPATRPAAPLAARPASQPADASGPPAVIEVGVLRFEKVPLRHKRQDGSVVRTETYLVGFPGLDHIVRCTDALDVAWGPQCVNFMREPGLLEETFSVGKHEGFEFGDVQWDGRHLWVATLHHGLWAVDTSGKVVASVGEAEGLPPCDRAARLQVLGPDRLAIVGAFGPTHRAFLAMVEKEQTGYRAQVFHKAARVIEDPRSARDVADADLAFIPGDLLLCGPRTGGREGGGQWLVVRRDGATDAARYRPLLVDLKTLNASVATDELGAFPVLGCGGGILRAADVRGSISLLRPTDDGRDFRADLPPLRIPPASLYSWGGSSGQSWVVGPDGLVYLIGNAWYRLDPATMTVCRLTPDRSAFSLSRLWRAATCGTCGLVAWGEMRSNYVSMYRVRVDEARAKALSRPEWFLLPPATAQATQGMWLQVIELGAEPLATGGPFRGKVRFRNAGKATSGWVQVVTCVYRGDALLSRSLRRIFVWDNLLDTGTTWEATASAGNDQPAQPFAVPGPGAYRVELSLRSADEKDVLFDQQSIALTAK